MLSIQQYERWGLFGNSSPKCIPCDSVSITCADPCCSRDSSISCSDNDTSLYDDNEPSTHGLAYSNSYLVSNASTNVLCSNCSSCISTSDTNTTNIASPRCRVYSDSYSIAIASAYFCCSYCVSYKASVASSHCCVYARSCSITNASTYFCYSNRGSRIAFTSSKCLASSNSTSND